MRENFEPLVTGFAFGVCFDISALRECSLLLSRLEALQIYFCSQHSLKHNVIIFSFCSERLIQNLVRNLKSVNFSSEVLIHKVS